MCYSFNYDFSIRTTALTSRGSKFLRILENKNNKQTIKFTDFPILSFIFFFDNVGLLLPTFFGELGSNTPLPRVDITVTQSITEIH